jgi:hypothetical protein
MCTARLGAVCHCIQYSTIHVLDPHTPHRTRRVTPPHRAGTADIAVHPDETQTDRSYTVCERKYEQQAAALREQAAREQRRAQQHTAAAADAAAEAVARELVALASELETTKSKLKHITKLEKEQAARARDAETKLANQTELAASRLAAKRRAETEVDVLKSRGESPKLRARTVSR